MRKYSDGLTKISNLIQFMQKIMQIIKLKKIKITVDMPESVEFEYRLDDNDSDSLNFDESFLANVR